MQLRLRRFGNFSSAVYRRPSMILRRREKPSTIALVLLAALGLVAIANAQRKQNDGLLERAVKGEARIIDLSHKLNANVPAYGGERDLWPYERLADYERGGYAAGAFRRAEHFGTHPGSPAPFLKGRE